MVGLLVKPPLTVQLRKESGQNVTVEKAGYKSQTRELTIAMDGWFWGNIVFGGFLGSTTDGMTGAMHEYAPSQYYVTLASTEPTSPVSEHGEKAEVKLFIVTGYRQIMEDLRKGEGEYLSSLLTLLKVDEYNTQEAVRKIRSLPELYTTIPDFAEHVASYFLK